jgi:cytochrome c
MPVKLSHARKILTFWILTLPILNFAQTSPQGEQAFNECRACHSLEPNVHLIGPSLAGVINRPIGSIAN